MRSSQACTATDSTYGHFDDHISLKYPEHKTHFIFSIHFDQNLLKAYVLMFVLDVLFYVYECFTPMIICVAHEVSQTSKGKPWGANTVVLSLIKTILAKL